MGKRARWLVAGWLGLGVVLRVVAGIPACPRPTDAAHERWVGEAQWQAIQLAGLRYGAIHVEVDNVYDLANPRENVWYTRAADFLHIRTRDWVVHHLLLIQPGQPVNAQQVYEAIRHLRAQTFLRGADITPMDCANGAVDVRVDVRDAWTLKIDTRFARAGNANEWRFKLEDSNFLGTGRTLAIGRQKTVERSMNVLEYLDPTLLNTDWTLAAYYEDLSDGKFQSLALSKPFLLDTTPWGADVTALTQHLNLGFYDRGVQQWSLPQRERMLQADWQKLLAFDGETAWRAGVALDYERYTYGMPVRVNAGDLPPPAPDLRTLAGVGPIVSLHQDRYASFVNLREVARAEDYNLGWDVSAQALYDSTAFGASANGPNVSVTVSKGFEPLPRWLVLADGSLMARRDGGQWRNEAFNAEATAYGQPWRRQTLVFHIDVASLLHPDPENRLYIGGFQALRGYPNFYATGTRRVRVTLADRIVTPMVWFHTFQVGFVVFNDDAIIDRSAGQGWSPWYSSVGAGFRIGNLRGSFNRVLYFTVAEPLRTDVGVRRRPQFVVGDVLTF
ncbi:MAG: hypothetical protein OJF55_000457 [Rhodanobacteraceae bacterium]|jgi:hypothetical protein|nr:MAG: hypothetical protein OJF55_000457 [Rhodanobacteraceae bacterium]